MDRPRVSRNEGAFIIGVPLASAVLLLFHPKGVMIGGHPPPFGPIALACFIAAVLVFWRSQQTALAPARAGQPSST
jgi:hypothetical protein